MAVDSGVFTSAGTKIFVSAGVPATLDQAGFEALSYTQIKDVTDIPEHGVTYEEITHKPLDSRETIKLKGGKDSGNLTLAMGRWSKAGATDPGQDILVLARDSDSDYAFKVEYNDNPDGTSNSIDYFQAKVMGMPKGPGTTGSVTSQNTALSISGPIIEVDAVA
jgi:hypothetical protein